MIFPMCVTSPPESFSCHFKTQVQNTLRSFAALYHQICSVLPFITTLLDLFHLSECVEQQGSGQITVELHRSPPTVDVPTFSFLSLDSLARTSVPSSRQFLRALGRFAMRDFPSPSDK